MTHQEAILLLEKLYASLPAIVCQGHCTATCGPVALSVLEAKRIRRGSSRKLEPRDFTCPALHKGRCTIYPIRPMICRLFGIIEGMPCHWGCKPDRLMSDSEATMLLHVVEEISEELWPGQGTVSLHDPEVFQDARVRLL